MVVVRVMHDWGGGMCGGGGGACVGGDMYGGKTVTEAGGTHPTGMHSCFFVSSCETIEDQYI